MLSAATTDLLNKQINMEFYSSNLYLQMSSWCHLEGLEGCAAFLRQHADEEMGHMKRVFTYVNETGALAVLGAIEAPAVKYDSVKDVFEKIFAHERHVTKRINDLAHAAFTEHDMSTFNFLQWFVAEQHEEETLIQSILDRIKVIGLDGKGVFFIDREVGRLSAGLTGAGPADEAAV